MDRCPTTQIVLCQGEKCTMYCPNNSSVLLSGNATKEDTVRMNTWGNQQRFSNETVDAKGYPSPGKEGYCIDSEGNNCTKD